MQQRKDISHDQSEFDSITAEKMKCERDGNAKLAQLNEDLKSHMVFIV